MSCSFLLVSWGTSGNLNPLLTAGRQLRKSGHRIRVMADPAMCNEVEHANFEFVPWRRAPTGSAADPSDFSDMKGWLHQAVFAPAGAYAADVKDEIGRVSTDAVICIDVLFGGLLGAEATGVPFAILSPHVSVRPLPGLPPATTGLMPPRNAKEWDDINAVTAQYLGLVDEFRPNFNATRAELGLPGLSHVFDLFDRADRCLLAISRSFDFEADFLPRNLRYVGPLLDIPSWSKPWRAPWPAQFGRPRALITCSTGAQGQRDLVQRAIDAMKTMKIDAVVTTGPNLRVTDVRAAHNVHVIESAPHDAVMKDVSVVISQGGHGTVCRALMHGLPQLVLPNGRDQADNAARVEAKGVGLRLAPTASADDISVAVSRLLNELPFRIAARRLGKAIKSDMAASAIVTEMEAIAAARRAA